MISTFISQDPNEQVRIYKEQRDDFIGLVKKDKFYHKSKLIIIVIGIFTAYWISRDINIIAGIIYGISFLIMFAYVFGWYWPQKVSEKEKEIFFKSRRP